MNTLQIRQTELNRMNGVKMTIVEMSRAMPSQKQIELAKETLKVLAEAVRELERIPGGYLYAQVMDKLDFEVYQVLEGSLISSGLIEKKHDLLIWKGE